MSKLALELQYHWEHFDKNGDDPGKEFEPMALALIKEQNFDWVNESQFENNLLNKYQERVLDDYTDSGKSLQEWFFDEIFVLGKNSIEHYQYYIDLCLE